LEVTEQRISLLLVPLLLAAVGCGGGGGAPIDVGDPAAPPKVADQLPPATNQNPASSAAEPPDNSQDPPADPSGPGASSGGVCVALCRELPAHDCEAPEDGCRQGCSDLLADDCGPQLLALAVCSLDVACPEQLVNISVQRAQQVASLCPDDYLAFLNCRNSLPND
jgi:hypothetical protein